MLHSTRDCLLIFEAFYPHPLPPYPIKGEGEKDAADNAFTRIVYCSNIICALLPFNSLIVAFFSYCSLFSYLLLPSPQGGRGAGGEGFIA